MSSLPATLDDLSGRRASNELIGVRPVTVRRQVEFGDCDPAGIVYTPRFADYLIGAFYWFMAVVLENGEKSESSVSTPMRGLELDFRRMLAPGDWFELRCHVKAIRTRTFDLSIIATDATSATAFVGRLTPIALDRTSGKAVALPEILASRLAEYQTLCPLPTE